MQFDAILADDDPDRKVFVHPEDEELDKQPTLFQQFVGELQGGEESDSEDEGDKKKVDDKKAPEVKKDAGKKDDKKGGIVKNSNVGQL